MADDKKVVVIKHDNNEKRSGWSLVKYGRETWRNIIWVALFGVVCAAVGAIGLNVVINSSKKVVRTAFSYNLPILEDEEELIAAENGYPTFTFFDGTQFKAHDVYSYDSLLEVKNSDEKYKDVNLNAILSSSGVRMAVQGYTNNNDRFVPYFPFEYEMVLKQKAFPSKSIARSFVNDMVELPLKKARHALENYSVATPISEEFDHLDFNKRVSMLNSLYNSIYSAYQDLGKEVELSYLADANGSTLGAKKRDFEVSWFSGESNAIYQLQGEIVKNNYLFYEEGHEAEKINEIEVRANEDIDLLKTYISSADLLIADYERLSSFSGIITDNTELTEKIVEAAEKITEQNNLLSEVLTDLQHIGYECAWTDASGRQIEITEVKTLEQAAKIRVSETARGYLQYLNNPSLDNWKENCAKFADKLSIYKDKLTTNLVTANEVFHYIYGTYFCKVTYSTPGGAVTSGGYPWVLGAAAGLILGLVVSSLFATAIAVSKEKESINN